MSPPSSVPVVRPATLTDLSELVRVINVAYRVEAFFIDGDRIDEAGIRSRFSQSGGLFLVAEGSPADSLVGAVYCVVDGVRGFFALLSVDPVAQGRGIGRQLIAAVEAHCRRSGCRHLELDVVDLREELPPFYRRLGFTNIGTAPFPDPGKLRRPAEMLRMQKRLDSVDPSRNQG
jgi:GNAT superfamily N-acetyltransferase